MKFWFEHFTDIETSNIVYVHRIGRLSTQNNVSYNLSLYLLYKSVWLQKFVKSFLFIVFSQKILFDNWIIDNVDIILTKSSESETNVPHFIEINEIWWLRRRKISKDKS